MSMDVGKNESCESCEETGAVCIVYNLIRGMNGSLNTD